MRSSAPLEAAAAESSAPLEAAAAQSSARPSKARRLAPTAIVKPEPPSIDQPVTLSLSQDCSISMQGVPIASVATVHTVGEFAALLKQQAQVAAETHDSWACTPGATWIRTLIDELKEPAQRSELRRRQRGLATMTAEDFGSRWSLSAEFAKAVCDMWLQSRSLEEVLTKSDAFGHGALKSGLILSGGLAREWASAHEVKLGELLSWVRALTAEGGSASLYRVEADNAFQTEDDTSAPLEALEAELTHRLKSGRGGCGSLDSTHEFDGSDGAGESGVPPLDGLMAQMDDLAYLQPGADAATRLNSRLYLIWKLQGYCTPYHQDIHVPPHFTLYNQLSGVSTFHFLPLLVGLYATHVGRTAGPEALRHLLTTLAERGIGEVATIGPKHLLLILPSGAHGVFVPRVASETPGMPPPANASLPRFDFSVIRAAELFVTPVQRLLEGRLMSDAWWQMLALSAEEAAEEAARESEFAGRQEALCRAMGLQREEWLYLATRLQKAWDADADGEGRGAPQAGGDLEGDIVDNDDSL